MTTTDSLAHECAEIAEKTANDILCMVKSSLITWSAYVTWQAAGFEVKGTATDDGAGNVTCHITVKTGTA